MVQTSSTLGFYGWGLVTPPRPPHSADQDQLPVPTSIRSGAPRPDAAARAAQVMPWGPRRVRLYGKSGNECLDQWSPANEEVVAPFAYIGECASSRPFQPFKLAGVRRMESPAVRVF